MKNSSLSPEQQAVLFEKATEAPFSGKWVGHHGNGAYTCANCGAQLFASDNKFDSSCGWPSFDQAIKDSVTYTEDISHGMHRTEVTCSHCGGHLGHVFTDGPKETTGDRYCINSLSLNFTEKG